MLLIPCPHCGERNEHEFVCGGDAERMRPPSPQDLDDAAWQDYLYNNTNTKGWVRERWWHVLGCGRWFEIERHTATHAIRQPEGSGGSDG